MKNIYFALLISLGLALTSFAQDTAITTDNDPATTIVLARTGVRTDAPHVGTYHMVEAFQVRGKWIVPDVCYIDYGTGNYHELCIGAGRTFYDGKRAMVASELYFAQATGPAAKSARYLWPWTIVQFHFTKKWNSEAVYFPYLPLNSSARIQHVIERAKVEYTINKTFKVGGGYAGYRYGDDTWQSKPMLTTTISTKRTGAFEFWLQKMPGGGQIQFRYVLAYAKK